MIPGKVPELLGLCILCTVGVRVSARPYGERLSGTCLLAHPVRCPHRELRVVGTVRRSTNPFAGESELSSRMGTSRRGPKPSKRRGCPKSQPFYRHFQCNLTSRDWG